MQVDVDVDVDEGHKSKLYARLNHTFTSDKHKLYSVLSVVSKTGVGGG